MSLYIYRGTKHDLDEPITAPPSGRGQKFTGFNPDACGTYPGYRRHQKWGVPACQDCKDAQAAYSRDRYVPKKRPGFRDDACGTWAGWHRHKYHNIPTCTACEKAAREYQRDYRAARKERRAVA